MSFRGLRNAGENLQQSGFSCAIPADQTYHFAHAHFERYAAQCPKVTRAAGRCIAIRTKPAHRGFHGVSESLAHSRLARKRANAVALPQSIRVNGDITHSSDHIRDRTLHGVEIYEPA